MTSIAIFAYAFKHKKTSDFLRQIAQSKVGKVVVFGAPLKKLKIKSSKIGLCAPHSADELKNTEDLCNDFGFIYVEADHQDYSLISDYVDRYEISMAIISGARILRQEILGLFPNGVVNFHPGKIPETSGLDSFYYMLEKGAPPIVTTHLIDERVDAGYMIYSDEVKVSVVDTPSSIIDALYQTQLVALCRLLKELPILNRESLHKLSRPSKNPPMSDFQRETALKKFPDWLVNCYYAQSYQSLLNMVLIGNLHEVRVLLDRLPFFLGARDDQHRTLLMIAAFYQHHSLVEYLLLRGLDPNAYALKGTTALMYAKTNIKDDPGRFQILETLMKAGANPLQKDFYGRDIFSYLNPVDDKELIHFLRNFK